MEGFLHSFKFFGFEFDNYKYTDNTAGAPCNFIAKLICGTSEIVCENGEKLTLCGGDHFFIPKGLKYRSYWHGSPKIAFLSYGFVYMPVADGTYFPLQKLNVSQSYEKLFDTVEIGYPATGKSIGAFYELFDEFLKLAKQKEHNNASRLVLCAEELLRKDTSVTVKELARKMGVSESTVYAAFKANSSLTPTELKQRILCEEAVGLLTSTDESVEEVSYRLGFSSSSYFRKVFKKHMGISPREARNKFTV